MTEFQNKLRFFHTTDLNADRSTWREVFPLGSKAYEWKKDKTEVFYRQDKKGGFMFTNYVTDNNLKIEDFEFFNELNNNGLVRCATRFIVTERNCGGEWTIAHIGKFTMNDCEFDLDKCTINAKQSLVDDYSCLKENQNEKYNILQTAPDVTVFSPVQNNFDFHSNRNSEFLDSAFGGLASDGTGGWKRFFTKTAINTPQPALTYYTDNTSDDYFDCKMTPNHAIWIKKKTGVPDDFQLQVYRFADSSLVFSGGVLDVQSTLVVDSGMIGFTTNLVRDFKVYRPDTNTLLTIVANHTADIVWFDIEDDDEGTEKFAFYYDANNVLFAYDFTTSITRVVDNPLVSTYAEQVTGNTVLNISYGEGVLVYHDTTTNELKRYSPSNFIVTVIQSVTQIKFVYSEASFITWFNIDDETMYLQNRDDTTFENIVLRFNDGDCRYFARENEWIVFDDVTPIGVQIAINLINREVWSAINGTAIGTPILYHYKIENGWFLFAMQSVGQQVAIWLDTKQVGCPACVYEFDFSLAQSTIQMSAGIERIYVSGKTTIGGFPQPYKIWSIDIETEVVTEIEVLGTVQASDELNCLKMNGCGQILSTNENRVSLTKENIQRDDELSVYFREKTVTISVGGNPTAPLGLWSLYKDQSNEFGFATWVRQPALAPPPLIDIVEGGCLCTDDLPDNVVDEDECVSINPNVNITDFLMNPTTALTTPVIRGYTERKQPLGAFPTTSKWYIENPRDGSTYTWAIPFWSGATIINGQGTPIVEVQLTSAFVLRQIECQEVNPCEIAPIPLATLPFIYKPWNGFPSGLCQHNIPDVITPNTYSGGSGKVVAVNSNLSIFGESSSSITILPDGRRETVAQHNGVAGFSIGATVTPCPPIGGNIPIVPVPSPLPIVSPLEVCPTGLQTYHVETPRDGCAYSWTVDSPCFIVGSTIGTSVVVDMNNATGVEQLHLNESCPIQPVNYQLIAPCDKLHSDSWWWIIGQDVEYRNGRLLKNVIEDLVASICPEITAIRSDFFQWNPLNPSLIQYVYGGINQYNYLTIHQKSDIRNPNATEKATIGNLTWKQFVSWLKNMEVYYIIIDGELHIEHISRFIGTTGLDTTVLPFSEFADYRRQFSYDKFEMARIESFKWMEEQNAEFVGFPIEYKDFNNVFSLCVNEDEKEEDWKELTTDLKFIQTNPSDISNNGFVILANTFNGVDYDVIEDAGVITGVPILNSPMSLSALQDRFSRHNRILIFGHLNRQFTNFESSQFFKKQKKFKIPFCCETVFNPIDLVKTTLGEGQIESAEIDFETDTIDLKLKYE